MQSQQANKQTLVTYLLALKAGEKDSGQSVDGFKKYVVCFTLSYLIGSFTC